MISHSHEVDLHGMHGHPCMAVAALKLRLFIRVLLSTKCDAPTVSSMLRRIRCNSTYAR
jgi:hypothetical protein